MARWVDKSLLGSQEARVGDYRLGVYYRLTHWEWVLTVAGSSEILNSGHRRTEARARRAAERACRVRVERALRGLNSLEGGG